MAATTAAAGATATATAVSSATGTESNLSKLTRIAPDYTLAIPDEFQSVVSIGEAVVVSADGAGRLIITPVDHIRQQLMETFGMWADRADIPAESTEHVDLMRRGHRLEAFQRDEVD